MWNDVLNGARAQVRAQVSYPGFWQVRQQVSELLVWQVIEQVKWHIEDEIKGERR